MTTPRLFRWFISLRMRRMTIGEELRQTTPSRRLGCCNAVRGRTGLSLSASRICRIRRYLGKLSAGKIRMMFESARFAAEDERSGARLAAYHAALPITATEATPTEHTIQQVLSEVVSMPTVDISLKGGEGEPGIRTVMGGNGDHCLGRK